MASFDEPSKYDNVTFFGGADSEDTYYNNNNTAPSASAQASTEVTRASAKAKTSSTSANVLEKLRAYAKMEGAEEFFTVLDTAPKAKAAIQKQLAEGHKVAIFAPTNRAMAQFHEDTDKALKRASNRQFRENFASQHMSLNLHQQIAEARMDGHENPAFPSANAALHVAFNENQGGDSHSVALLRQDEETGQALKRASANSDTMFSYKGNTLHIVDNALAN